MAIVKLDALEALKATIETAIPTLVGKVVVQQAVASKIESFPNASISLIGRMTFNPAEKYLHQDLGGNVVVWNVGAHEGVMQMRIVASSTRERSELEQQMIDLSLARDGGAGVIVVPVTSSPAISWVAAYEFEDAQWMDQRAIEREFEAVLTFNAVIPALVTQSPVYTIDTLVLGLTSDMTKVFTPGTFAPPDVELVVINQDGTLSPAP